MSAALSRYANPEASLGHAGDQAPVHTDPRIELSVAAARLCDLVEAFQRAGDDAVPLRLRDTTDADLAQAVNTLRVALNHQSVGTAFFERAMRRDLLTELQAAGTIIHNALQLMTSDQKRAWGERNEADGAIADLGITRRHERDAVIARATGSET